MLHSLLLRHLKKSGIEETQLPTNEQWMSFLQRVNQAYTESDQERYLMERSLTISSQEMREAYEKLSESEARYALAEQGANDGLWDWSLEREEIYYSPRCLEILGVLPDAEEKPSKSSWLEKIHPHDRTIVINELDAHLLGTIPHFENEHRILNADDTFRWVLIRGLAVRDESGKAHRIAGSITDITERKLAEERLAHDAIHDSLTGVPNRKFLMERLERSLERLRFGRKYSFATLFIDLDRFKQINDSMGHQVGDELLKSVTARLTKIIRPRDMLARLGGDEFVIIIEGATNTKQVFPVADRILKELQKPLIIGGQEIFTSASIGIVFGSHLHEKAEDLVRDADLAMYRAKIKGKGRYELFESEMHSGMISLMYLEMDLRRAIERKEFVLNYQPIVSLENGDIKGFEALIRWNHPAKGLVGPNDFIPVAEETGLILPIGSWVLYESCRQMQEWKEMYSYAKNLIISVNFSAKQLEEKDLIENIARILKETGLDPAFLKLEITESAIMQNAEHAIEVVTKLKSMGIRLSIDDFGTGYSSLSYLHKFPIDTLKVDRSFINRIAGENDNSQIVQTIVNLAVNLGIDVVAEGVETIEQLNFLQGINCEFGQGYYYSRPVEAAAAEEMIERLSIELDRDNLYQLSQLEAATGYRALVN